MYTVRFLARLLRKKSRASTIFRKEQTKQKIKASRKQMIHTEWKTSRGKKVFTFVWDMTVPVCAASCLLKLPQCFHVRVGVADPGLTAVRRWFTDGRDESLCGDMLWPSDQATQTGPMSETFLCLFCACVCVYFQKGGGSVFSVSGCVCISGKTRDKIKIFDPVSNVVRWGRK